MNGPSWKTVSKKLQLGSQKFLFPFLLAAVRSPILGINSLAKHKFLVDSFNYRVVDKAIHLQFVLPVDHRAMLLTIVS